MGWCRAAEAQPLVAFITVLLFLSILGVYLAAGLVFAVWFAFAGVQRLDPVAEEAGPGFRLMVIPGAAALWPLLIRKLVSGGQA